MLVLDARNRHCRKDGAHANCCPLPRMRLVASRLPLIWRKSTPGLVKKIWPSNRSQPWSASQTYSVMAFSNSTLIGTLCAATRASRKLSPRWRLSSRQANPCYIKHRLADAIYPEVFFDQCVLEGSSAKRRQTEPGCYQTKRLAQMTGVEEHHAIGTSVTILPHGARKDSRH